MMTEQELNNLINSRPTKLAITSIAQEMMHLSRALEQRATSHQSTLRCQRLARLVRTTN